MKKMDQPKPPYQPLENYGMIGNLHTAALVGINGSIDWCCLPHFNSPSIFGSLLDSQKGGYCKISPTGPKDRKQFYLSDSNILITRFLSPEGVGEIVDFMPVPKNPTLDTKENDIYRIVRVVRGTLSFNMECFPAFNYARASHRITRREQDVLFESGKVSLMVRSRIPLHIENTGVTSSFTLKADESAEFILRFAEKNILLDPDHILPPAEDALKDTLNYWRTWISKLEYKGRWREMVTRSALVLKMLTFAPTGATVAAATTSLPEVIGGHRNWDYRCTWIRDSSFILHGLLRLGFTEEVDSFMKWLEARMTELNPDGSLQVVYGLQGEHNLTEKTLPHLDGYLGSKPVRIGNAADEQKQLDIYGELMDLVFLYDQSGSPISYDLWMNLRRLLNYVCAHWREKDKGIWEVRNAPQHFVYSKVMCWVALDRGLRIAEKRSFPTDRRLWAKTRDAIYEEVMTKGWNAKHNTFVQYYGTAATDASSLVMPLVKFISPTDPRMISTLARIKETLVSDSLVYRYEIGKGIGDGLSGREGTFSMCTFWYAETLARSGQLQEARWTFEKMLGYASPLGLYAEEIGPSGKQMGNFPQAFTHVGLISAAYTLDKALDDQLTRSQATS